LVPPKIHSPVSFFLLYHTKKRKNLTSFVGGNSNNLLLKGLIAFFILLEINIQDFFLPKQLLIYEFSVFRKYTI